MSYAIVDAHHHIWRKDRTPWLDGPTAPRIFGDYAAIRRDYGIDEFAADATPSGVAASVYVQVNLAPGDEIWEVEWAAAEGRKRNLVNAVVAFADLTTSGSAKRSTGRWRRGRCAASASSFIGTRILPTASSRRRT